MSFQGEIGARVEFDYHIPTGRYYVKDGAVPCFDMTLDKQEKQELPEKVEAMQVNENFDNELDELPW